MSQQPHPTFINLPQPPSHPDTPSETPGTPTSTTTSLSALSTTAIKDGYRGALHHRGHHHSASTNSLEAERADRISRLTGLSGISTLRGPPAGLALAQHNANSPQNTPPSTGLTANPTTVAAAAGLTPAFFDATGQPVAATKVSTVGSASATESVGGRTNLTTEVGGDNSTLGEEREDEDMLTEMDSASASGYMGADAMDEDLDNLATQSVGGFEDRMSDDGNASLVGFGEGAGSTLSGPIYQRRPLPTQSSGTAGPGAAAVWASERSASGLSEGATTSPNPHHIHHHQQHHQHHLPQQQQTGPGGRRDLVTRPSERENNTDTPVSQSAVRERREARIVDGVALDNSGVSPSASRPGRVADDDVFVDTTTRGPVPMQPSTSAAPTTSSPNNSRDAAQQPHAQQRQPVPRSQHHASSSPREAAERILHERLDEGEARVGAGAALGSPKAGERLGRFYFEDR